jgi:hypothetical protein
VQQVCTRYADDGYGNNNLCQLSGIHQYSFETKIGCLTVYAKLQIIATRQTLTK